MPITDKRQFQRLLLNWFADNARDLAWRRTRDPYAIWVSEIMLQQTQVATVEAYFERFLAAFPSIAALAAAEERQVLRLWEGLGYYRRARQFHAAARRIVAEHDGQFPIEIEQVRRLPGIGRYTAGAILSIAFDAAEPILEANTVRLLSRLVGFGGDPHSTTGQNQLWQVAEELLPERQCGAFNQALMELGSQICRPRNPRCDVCPVREHCRALAAGLQDVIPRPKPKPVVVAVREAALAVQRQGKILLLRRQRGERWAGLWDFPRFTVAKTQTAALVRELNGPLADRTGIQIETMRHLATMKHSVTRFRISLECYHAAASSGRLRAGRDDLQWVRPADLPGFPLNTTGRKISRILNAL